MGNKAYGFTYRGNPLSDIGDFQPGFEVPIPIPGTLVAIYFRASSVSAGFSGTWYIGAKLDSTPILAGAERMLVTSGDLTPESTGLSEAVTLRQIFKVYVETAGEGTINGPIHVVFVIRPDAKTVLDDDDEVGLTEADGTPVHITGANLKTAIREIVPVPIGVACSDETTAITAGTGKATFRMPMALIPSEVRASLTTAQASGSVFTVDINESGTSILSTKITIDNTEKTSETAATPPVISDVSLADDAEMTVDVDQIGDGTAKGLKIWIIGFPA